jgi:hypothetical protein
VLHQFREDVAKVVGSERWHTSWSPAGLEPAARSGGCPGVSPYCSRCSVANSG